MNSMLKRLRKGLSLDRIHEENNEIMEGKESTLHVACSEGNVDMIRKALSDKKQHINSKDSSGKTPIFRAIENGRLDATEYLLKKGALVWTNETSALHVAVESNQSDIVKLILKQTTIDVNCSNSCGQNPLQIAARNGFLSSTQQLIQHRASVKTIDHKRRSVLHLAVSGKNLDVAKYLVRSGCNINAQDEEGSTVLHLAAEMGSVRFVHFLLNVKADPNITDGDGYLPAHLLVRNPRLNIMLSNLLDKTSDINAQNCNGDTPLHCAVLSENLQAVRILCETGADVNIVNNAGLPPL